MLVSLRVFALHYGSYRKPEFKIYGKMKKEEGGRRKKTEEGGLQCFFLLPNKALWLLKTSTCRL